MQATEIIFEDFEPAAVIPAHIDFSLLAAYADNEGIDNIAEAVEGFEDNFQGIYDNLTAWAEQLLEETGELEAMPAHLRYYFDHEAYARDCQLGGDIYTIDTKEGTAVFWNR